MKRLFVSYSRDDKAWVDDLARRLQPLTYETWIDSKLQGGQDWWDVILSQIAACDAFIAVVSQSALASIACGEERRYAAALGKPILPVAVEELTQAMPRELSMRQVVNFADTGQDAAFAFFGALQNLPDAPPLPDPLPVAPPVPLSYQSVLVDLLAEPVLTKAQQRQVLDEVEPALRSPDRDARVGAMQILESMQGREDLYADVAARVAMLLASRGPSEREPLPPPPPPPPPEPRPVKKSSGVRTLLIVLVVLGVLGLGGCLAVVGALSSVAPQPTPTSYAPAPLPATTSYVPAPQPATPSPVTPIGPNGEQLGDICTADTPYGPQQGLVYGVVGNPTAYCLGYDGILYGFY